MDSQKSMESDNDDGCKENAHVDKDHEDFVVELLTSKFATKDDGDKKEDDNLEYSWEYDIDNESALTHSTRSYSSAKSKAKANESMTSQSILTCASQVDNAISLIENFDKCNSRSNDDTNQLPMKQKKDFNLALKALKKVKDEMTVVTNVQSNTYVKQINKWKKVEDEDKYIAKHGLRRSDHSTDKKKQKLLNNRREVKKYIADPSPAKEKSTNIQNSERLKSVINHQMTEVKRGTSTIVFPLPRLGSYYFPEEMCDILTNKIDQEHMYFVLKQMIALKLIPCKECMALRHVAKYKAGKKVP